MAAQRAPPMPENQTLTNLKQRLAREYRAAFARVVPPGCDYDRIADEFYSEERAAEQVDLVLSQLSAPMAGGRVLEVGSAYGVLLPVLRRSGAVAFGVEPAGEDFSGTLHGAREYLGLMGEPLRLAGGTGEALPFGDGVFDAVCSFNVLEHVQDLDAVIGEIVRVLAPGGRAVLIAPNYGSWWEGHYGLLWLPHMPPWLARLYVRLWGRDPAFIDTLQFITPGRLRRALAPHAHSVRVLSWGHKIWRDRLLAMDVKSWANLGILRRAVQALHALRLHRLVAWLGVRLNWQTPIILVFEKTEPS